MFIHHIIVVVTTATQWKSYNIYSFVSKGNLTGAAGDVELLLFVCINNPEPINKLIVFEAKLFAVVICPWKVVVVVVVV